MAEDEIQVEAPSKVIVSYKDPEACSNGVDRYMDEFCLALGLDRYSDFGKQMEDRISNIVHKNAGECMDIEIDIITAEASIMNGE